MIDYLAIPVSDQERSRRFYETYAGFGAEPAPAGPVRQALGAPAPSGSERPVGVGRAAGFRLPGAAAVSDARSARIHAKERRGERPVGVGRAAGFA